MPLIIKCDSKLILKPRNKKQNSEPKFHFLNDKLSGLLNRKSYLTGIKNDKLSQSEIK